LHSWERDITAVDTLKGAVMDFENEIKGIKPGTIGEEKNGETPQLAHEDGQIAPRFQFIEEALAEGANIDRLSVQANGSEWTVVSFKNAEGTFLLNGEDVYVTQASIEDVHASIEANPVTLPGLNDIGLAGEIEIEVPDISFSKVLESM